MLKHHALRVSGFALAFGSVLPAHADLAPAFAGKLNVNTAYVTNANEATDIAFSGDDRAVVTSKSGQIFVRRSDGSVVTIAYPFGGTLDTASEKGLLGVVADPNVAQNHAFYFYVSNGPTSDKHRVYRTVLTASNALTVDTTPIIAAARGLGPGLEGPANHDGGGLFIAGGKLYVGVGDTGSNATPPVNKYASCLNKGNGKILRVNLDGSVPADNPLVGLASVTACASPTGAWSSGAPDPRIYAWGTRNPWRFWLDPLTSSFWIGDVGEVTEEEVSLGSGDHHFGYPFVEGNHVWGDVNGKNCTSLTPSRACTPPVYSYPRSVGQAITGGLIPSGCGWSTVFATPSYVYADSSAGFMRALPVNAGHTALASTTPLDIANYGGTPVSFRMGPDAALYVVFYGLGAVYRFTPTERAGADCTAVPSSNAFFTVGLAVVLAAIGVLVIALQRRRRAAL